MWEIHRSSDKCCVSLWLGFLANRRFFACRPFCKWCWTTCMSVHVFMLSLLPLHRKRGLLKDPPKKSNWKKGIAAEQRQKEVPQKKTLKRNHNLCICPILSICSYQPPYHFHLRQGPQVAAKKRTRLLRALRNHLETATNPILKWRPETLDLPAKYII